MGADPKVEATSADRKFRAPPSASEYLLETLRLAEEAEAVAILVSDRLADRPDEFRPLGPATRSVARTSRKIVRVVADLLDSDVLASEPANDGPRSYSVPEVQAMLLSPREKASCVVAGNAVYVIGGACRGRAIGSIEQATLGADGSLSRFEVANATLTTPRFRHTSAVVGNVIYVIGGWGTGVLGSVERAILHPDRGLSSFHILPDAVLSTARLDHSTVVVGNSIYVIGGACHGSTLDSVERATINAEGTLSPFVHVPDVALTISRRMHTSTVVGGFVYVIGGMNDDKHKIGQIERATIHADGSLSTFSVVSRTALTTARHSHISVALDDALYVVGGCDDRALDSVEHAAIGADGSLSPFTTAADLTLTTARHGHVGFAADDAIYVAGGADDRAFFGSVERIALDRQR